MTNEAILKKAIEKVEQGGWSFDEWLHTNWSTPTKQQFLNAHPDEVWSEVRDDAIKLVSKSYFIQIIFSHDFAKAFWGEDLIVDDWQRNPKARIEYWKYRLREMVLEENPIKYLEKFI